MPLLVAIIGIQTATPAYALLGALDLAQHHSPAPAPTPGDLARLVMPALAGIPLGILCSPAWIRPTSRRHAGRIPLIGYAHQYNRWAGPCRLWLIRRGRSGGFGPACLAALSAGPP